MTFERRNKMSQFSQTLKNMIYLLLSFPLGILYFVCIITGLSVGFALSFTLIGIPILILVLHGSREALKLEALLARVLLGEEIRVNERGSFPKLSTWEEAKHRLTSSYYWGAILYLLIKFPLGIFSFICWVVCITVPISLILQPFTYSFTYSYFITGRIDTMVEALFCCILGLALIPILIKAINKVTGFIGAVTKSSIENVMNQSNDNVKM